MQPQTSIISAEDAHEQGIEKIAQFLISRRGEIRLVLVGGPSSAGKTTFAKRLQFHLESNGATTLAISTDDYFVGDSRNPRDANGNLDYEHIRAMDLDMLNANLVDLLAGRKTLLPRFDFLRHEPAAEKREAQLPEGAFAIIEGLHSLNPELTPLVPKEAKHLILADTLTNPFAACPGAEVGDQRLIRRIIRDSKYRGRSAADTIRLWASVRAGEERWIQPFTGNAETTFDTTLAYEPSVLRMFAAAPLAEIDDSSPAYPVSRRLLSLLEGFKALDPSPVPPYSILREYIGGSIIQY